MSRIYMPLPAPPVPRMWFGRIYDDSVQTHALYGAFDWETAECKAWLKSQGATRFQVIKGGSKVDHYAVICFKWQKKIKK